MKPLHHKILFFDYPNEPIGGGNPYYRCSVCKISDPQINGRLEGHAPNCSWALKRLDDIEKGIFKRKDAEIKEY